MTVKIISSTKRQLECKICEPNRIFKSKRTLKQHKWGFHNVFYCQKCGEKTVGRHSIATFKHH